MQRDRSSLVDLCSELSTRKKSVDARGTPSEVVKANTAILERAQCAVEERLPANESMTIGTLLSSSRKLLQLTELVLNDPQEMSDGDHEVDVDAGRRRSSSLFLLGLRGLLALMLIVVLLTPSIPVVFAVLLFVVYVGLDIVQWREFQPNAVKERRGHDPNPPRVRLNLPYSACDAALASTLGAIDGVVNMLQGLNTEIQDLRERLSSSDATTSDITLLQTFQKLLASARRENPELPAIVCSQVGLLLAELRVECVSYQNDEVSKDLFETQEDLSGNLKSIVELRPAFVQANSSELLLKGLVAIPGKK